MKRILATRSPSRALIGVVALAVITAFALLTGRAAAKTHITIELGSAVALYPGDEVRVLGVPVGNITALRPGPSGVLADVEYDSSVKVPADARAAVVSPSLVSTRFIQLTPAYRAGAVLQSGTVIPIARTATPVEFDQLKAQLAKVVTDLGSNGANQTGALNHALDVTASNVDGQGAALKSTIDQMSRAATTFSGGAGDLFTTVRNLNDFLTALNANDAQVRGFTTQLATFSGVLAGNRQELGRTLSNLDTALAKVHNFVEDNHDQLLSNVTGLGRFTGSLAEKRQSLADLLQIAPGTVENFYNIYDPGSGTLTGALADAVLSSPAQFVCSSLYSVGGTPEQCARALGPLLNLIQQDHIPVLGATPSSAVHGTDAPGTPEMPVNPLLPLLGGLGGGR